MKSTLSVLLIILLASSVFLICMQLGRAQGGTQVIGVLSSDTTWTKENSPYNFTGNVLVSEGITLTIEPGVTVNFNDYYLRIDGVLYARGTSNNKITFFREGSSIHDSEDSAIVFTGESISWNEELECGCIIENAVLNSSESHNTIMIQGGSPKICNSILINDELRAIFIRGGAPIISNNVITSYHGITFASPHPLWITENNGTVSDNIISGGEVGIEIYNGQPVIENNLIINNLGSKDSGGGIRIDVSAPIIRNNTITKNSVGINIFGGSPLIYYNNIYNNNEYNVYLHWHENVNVTFNWWGTTDVQAINQTIYDFKRDFTLGTVTFIPFLTSPNIDAPAEPEPTPTPAPTPTPTPTYRITITHVGEGTVSPSDGTHVVTSPLTLTATPATNYEFMCWLQNGTLLSSNNPYVYQPTNNYVITAVFYDPVSKSTPTPTPTEGPSQSPTSNPTSNPTQNPTTNPTATPSIPEFPLLLITVALMLATGSAALLTLKKKLG